MFKPSVPRFNPDPPPPLRTKRPPLRTIFLSVFLLLVGTGFIMTPFLTHSPVSEKIPFFFLGLICFVPGAYHVYIVIQICRGVKEYSYEQLLADD